MNTMIEFAKNNRTTTFFKSLAILKIRIIYRVMEYLAPDDHYPPEVNQFTKDLMLKEEFEKAYTYIIEELDQEHPTDLGCSAGEETLRAETIELMGYLLPIYQQTCTDKKEQRRMGLLKELKELDS